MNTVTAGMQGAFPLVFFLFAAAFSWTLWMLPAAAADAISINAQQTLTTKTAQSLTSSAT